MSAIARLRPFALLIFTLSGLVAGIVLEVAGRGDLATWAWMVPAAVVGVRLTVSIIRDLLAREAGVDIIAILAIAGALLLNESLAAAVIAVMLATGEALETYAAGRAQRELTALLGRAPQTVNRYTEAALEVVPIGAIQPGDRLLIRPGDVVPVDGVVRGEPAVLDESALTGEARLVTREASEAVSSGVVNAGGAFDLQATATADASTYAGIVRLVEEAGRAKAPFVRLADRYAILFVPLTLAIAGFAWALSGDPIRALAVLVVATPCPLLLAAPIAIVSGISRAARRGVIIKGGGPLETLARARVLLFDKTGTLTAGRSQLASVETPDGDAEGVLRAAASLEQASPHVMASAIVQAAHRRNLALQPPSNVVETAGRGVSGVVDGRTIAVGSEAYVTDSGPLPAWARDVRRRALMEGATNVFVRIDGQLAGVLVLDDPIRAEAPRAIRSLRRGGFGRIVMVTGDHRGVAELVGSALGLDGVLADRRPEEKVEAVRSERDLAGGPLVMVGDGINDAPALAVADVGVAMGARGATASSEAADVVITVDRLDRLSEAVRIARHARGIALQSVLVGMGLSLVAMVVAAFGYLPVVAGALVQEVIDVVVILNALRALRGGTERPMVVPDWSETGARLVAEHRQLAPGIARLRTVADGVDGLTPMDLHEELQAIQRFLVDTLLPHEEEEDRTVYPHLAAALGSDDATAALHRTHTEIFHLVRLLGQIVEDTGDDGPGADDRMDVRRTLYALHAILRLHMEQEEELYALIDAETSAMMVPSPA